MSRYEVDKLLRVITRQQTSRTEFLNDPVEFTRDADLTDQERKALIEKDFKTLYSLGAHSFLLYAFVMSVSSGDRKEVEAHYCSSIAPLGRVDYST